MAEQITLAEFEKAESELRAEERRRNFFMHTAVYVTVNVALIVSNMLLLPAYPWSLFPLVLWGIGLLAHYFVAFRWIESENEMWISQVEYRASKMHQAGRSRVVNTTRKAA